jgi:membrane-bound lytic murein transglycosylase B
MPSRCTGHRQTRTQTTSDPGAGMSWRGVAVALVATVGMPGLACGGSSAIPSGTATYSGPTAQTPAALAGRLAAADAALRASLEEWRTTDPGLRSAPPAAALGAAAKEREIVHQLAQDRTLAKRTLAALAPSLRATINADVLAARDLRRLTGPPSNTRLRLVPPRPAGELLADYQEAQARFGTRWQVLAAVNLVESAFGRVVNHSSAGAQGPMQFLPATWRAYGLGGDIHSPHDAITGAANYLHQSGALANDRHALYAYNPSRLYVDAVLSYAHEMIRDPLAYLTYYCWEASLPATLGG